MEFHTFYDYFLYTKNWAYVMMFVTLPVYVLYWNTVLFPKSTQTTQTERAGVTPPFFRARAPALARGALLAREHVPSAGHPSLPRHPLAAAPPGCYAVACP